ncbi:MAG: hypothetical protein ABSE59_09365 [Opitutaceae bacterium]|jgi:hypothetical protein
MNRTKKWADSPTRVFHFRATQLGKYFHGYCAGIREEEHHVTFLDRKRVRYIFEPGVTEPQIEIENAGLLVLLKKDFHIIATAVIPPRWFRPENREFIPKQNAP